MQQQNQIRAEQAKVSEYVGQEENLGALKAGKCHPGWAAWQLEDRVARQSEGAREFERGLGRGWAHTRA